MLPKLPTLAVLWMVLGPAGENVIKTEDGSSSDGGFGPRTMNAHKTANTCSSMDLFGPPDEVSATFWFWFWGNGLNHTSNSHKETNDKDDRW